MSTLQLLSVISGIGLLAGLRLYLTVLGLGLAIRFGWLEMPAGFENLRFLADWWVLGIASVCVAVEFLADKIPWVDSLWDSIHTLVRPVAAAYLGYAAVGQGSETNQIIAGLLAGSFALTSHTAKAATRLAVNHSPEPFSNAALSAVGDLGVPAGLWFTFRHPEWMLAIAVALLALVLAVSPRVFRLVRLEVHAIRSLLVRMFADSAGAEEVPPGMAGRIEQEFPEEPVAGCIRVAAAGGGGLRGLRNSIGWLCLAGTVPVFVTKRWGRVRLVRMDGTALRMEFRRRVLLDEIRVSAGGREFRFDVFKEFTEAAEALAGHDTRSPLTAPLPAS